MQCKIELTYTSHCVSKNLTPRRMLKKCFLIAKINHWNNSFRNMYDMPQAKIDRLARKTYFVKKKTLTMGVREGQNMAQNYPHIAPYCSLF